MKGGTHVGKIGAPLAVDGYRQQVLIATLIAEGMKIANHAQLLPVLPYQFRITVLDKALVS